MGECGVGVCGDGGLFVVGEYAPDQCGCLLAVAACLEVGAAELLVAVFVVAGGALVEVSGVGVAAAGHGDVEQGAAGVFAEYGVAGVGSDALGGVHGDRVARPTCLRRYSSSKTTRAPSSRRTAARRFVFALMPATRQRFPLRTNDSDCSPVVGSVTSRVGSLRRLMIRSPRAIRCPAAPIAVGAS